MSDQTNVFDAYAKDFIRNQKVIKAFNELFASYGTKYTELNVEDERVIKEFIQVRDDILNNKDISAKKTAIDQFILNHPTEKDYFEKFFEDVIDLPYYEDKKYGICCEKMDKNFLRVLYLTFLNQKRTRLSKEYDRIIVTNAFRHLQYKTQVMINSASDDQRTRLLHSIEVQTISKALALQLGANWELAEVIAIGHDVGHTPFGHAGEEQLNDCLSERYFGKFTHALQSVKVLNHLESHELWARNGLHGIGLCKHVLEGILKHDADVFTGEINTPALRLQYDCTELFDIVDVKNQPKPNEIPKIQIGGIESQIVHWADKIAYTSHDWEEFVGSDMMTEILVRVQGMLERMRSLTQMKLTEMNDCQEPFPKDKEGMNEEWKSIVGILKDVKTLTESINDNNMLRTLKDRCRKYHISCEYMKRKKTTTYFFTHEEYEGFFDFFNVARAWLVLLGDKLGEEPRPNPSDNISMLYNNNDVIYVLYRYMVKQNARAIAPVLMDRILQHTRENIKTHVGLFGENEFDDKAFRDETNRRWKENKEKEKQKAKKDRKEPKKIFRESLLVSMDENFYEELNIVHKFHMKHYIFSKKMIFMEEKEKTMIGVLFKYYYENPDLLPKETKQLIERTETYHQDLLYEILIDYYIEHLNEAKKVTTPYGAKRIQDSITSIKRTPKKEPLTCIHEWEKRFKKLKKALESMKRENLLAGAGDEEKKKFVNFAETVSGYSVQDVIRARAVADYIASLTDRMAIKKYDEITSSNTKWSKEYSD